ncbi:MAG: glucosaminidase domain-containing protein [Bacteroidota bacterium]
MKNRITQQNRTNVPQASEYHRLENISLNLLLKKWWNTIKKLWSVLLFHFHRYTFGIFKSVRLPVFQLCVLAFAIFILLKKDLHFQIHMKAPFSVPAASPVNHQAPEQFSTLPQINLSTTAPISPLNLPTEAIEGYISRFAKVAIQEQQKFGMPASVKMAQALLESHAGTSSSVIQRNNHFGTPFQEQHFSTAWESWRAHSLLFSSELHPYQQLLQHGKDYKKWAKGLVQLGYSQQADYENQLIAIIETYELFRLDDIVLK